LQCLSWWQLEWDWPRRNRQRSQISQPGYEFFNLGFRLVRTAP